MAEQLHNLTEDQVDLICERTDGYSCADMTNVCKEAAYGPIRSISFGDIEHITHDQVRKLIRLFLVRCKMYTLCLFRCVLSRTRISMRRYVKYALVYRIKI